MITRQGFFGFLQPFDVSQSDALNTSRLSELYTILRPLAGLALVPKAKRPKVDFPLQIFIRSGQETAQEVNNLSRFKHNRRDAGVHEREGIFICSICLANPGNKEDSMGENFFEPDFRDPTILRQKFERLKGAFDKYFDLAPYQRQTIANVFEAMIPRG